MGKGIQTTNTVITGIIAIILTIMVISSILFSFSTGVFKGVIAFGSIIVYILCISAIVYFILLIRSFSKCNINNSYFKWAFILNLIWVIGFILFFIGTYIFLISSANFDAINSANKNQSIVNYIAGFIYFISFLVFLIGYFKNKNKIPR